jgi:uncharacterized protein (DUF2141 family)
VKAAAHNLSIAVAITTASMAVLADPGPTRAPGPDTIRVEVSALHSSQGTVYCSIYAAPGDGFPVSADKALKAAQSKIAGSAALCEFNGLAPGVYAVGMIHDENDNKKLDTNWIGLPAEGYGTSRDAKAKFGPPRFKDAAFTYSGGSVRVPIHVRY